MNKAIEKVRGAIIYTRVSTGEQDKHGTSPETQIANCRAKALALGLPIISEYYDPGVSGGFLLARPGMQLALAAVREGRADTLICPNISRYSRSVEHQQAIKKAVKAAGGTLVFCDMNFEDTPEGDLNFTIQGGFAEYEKAVFKKRSMDGHKARASSGIQSGRGSSPFGYIIPQKADILRGAYPAEMLGKYLIVEQQAATVRSLFDWYDAGTHSLNDLAKWLNRSGLPTPRGGKMWRATNVRFILKNPVYKGVGVYGRFDHETDEQRLLRTHPRTGLPLTSAKRMWAADPETWITWDVPALVSADQWGRVNERLTENQRLKGGNPHNVRMLSGRVFCPHCGAGMACMSPTKSRSRKKGSTEVFIYPHRYACLRYRQALMETGEKGCESTGYYVHQVEAAVVQALLEACQRPEAIHAALAAYTRSLEAPKPQQDVRQEIAAVDRALAALSQRQTATVQAQIQGVMAGADVGVYLSLLADIAAERKDLENRLGRLSQSLRSAGKRQSGETRLNFTDLLDRARRVLQSEEVAGEVKRDILGTVIEKVICLKAEDKSAGAEVIFLPGVFDGPGEEADGDTLQTSNELPEISRFRAGNRHGSGRVPIGNSERTAPRPSAISSNKRRFSAG